MERFFLYLFNKKCHVRNFTKLLANFIERYCILPDFCCVEMKHYLIKFFVKCRVFQCLRTWNSKLRCVTDTEKVKKLTSK